MAFGKGPQPVGSSVNITAILQCTRKDQMSLTCRSKEKRKDIYLVSRKCMFHNVMVEKQPPY